MEDLPSFTKNVLSGSIKNIKDSSSLPTAGDEFEYYSNFNGYRTFCSRVGARINKLIGKVLQYEGVHVSWPSIDKTLMTSNELIDEQYDSIVESNDIILERIGVLLDKIDKATLPSSDVNSQSSHQQQQSSAEEGERGEGESTTDITTVPVASWNRKDAKVISRSKLAKMFRADVPRPQVLFKDMVDNSEGPFIPLLRNKPNALKPLPQVFSQLKSPCTLQALIENAKKWAESPDNKLYHPYQYELEVFTPPQEQLVIKEPIMYKSLEETELVMVNSVEELTVLLNELKNTTEIAIDLEAHQYRSFQGFVCLMQISTRTKDYIVDTLLLREHLHCLNEVFTDPKIVKVLHGADWDILWLQRDFGLYIVNLFDTGQASRVLGLPRYSLGFLLDYCCKVTANKQYQLADWRVRPLPPELIKYAREDTHYLLYVYDRMRNELIRRSTCNEEEVNRYLLHLVINNSRGICLKQYNKPVMGRDDYMKLCRKFKRTLSPPQLYCLKLLYEWRYNLARQEDESPSYVLPNHMLFQLAEILPRELQGIQACCNPVPTLLRQQLQEVHRLIQTAREIKVFPQETVPIKDPALSDKEEERDEVEREEMEIAVEEEEETDYGTTTNGPPIATHIPTVTFTTTVTKSNSIKSDRLLPQAVGAIYTRLSEMYINTLGQFMTPSLEGGQHLNVPTTFKSRREEVTPFHKPSSSSNKNKRKKTSPVEIEEGEISIQEEEQEDALSFKRPRLEGEGESGLQSSDFKAFDYSKTSFSSAVPAPKYTKPPKRIFGHTHKEKGPPRSKVTLKSSQKSGTFKTKNK